MQSPAESDPPDAAAFRLYCQVHYVRSSFRKIFVLDYGGLTLMSLKSRRRVALFFIEFAVVFV